MESPRSSASSISGRGDADLGVGSSRIKLGSVTDPRPQARERAEAGYRAAAERHEA